MFAQFRIDAWIGNHVRSSRRFKTGLFNLLDTAAADGECQTQYETQEHWSQNIRHLFSPPMSRLRANNSLPLPPDGSSGSFFVPVSSDWISEGYLDGAMDEPRNAGTRSCSCSCSCASIRGFPASYWKCTRSNDPLAKHKDLRKPLTGKGRPSFVQRESPTPRCASVQMALCYWCHVSVRYRTVGDHDTAHSWMPSDSGRLHQCGYRIFPRRCVTACLGA